MFSSTDRHPGARTKFGDLFHCWLGLIDSIEICQIVDSLIILNIDVFSLSWIWSELD